jgi:hypothetical protein
MCKVLINFEGLIKEIFREVEAFIKITRIFEDIFREMEDFLKCEAF